MEDMEKKAVEEFIKFKRDVMDVGEVLAKAMRDMKPHSPTPIVAMTAVSELLNMMADTLVEYGIEPEVVCDMLDLSIEMLTKTKNTLMDKIKNGKEK